METKIEDKRYKSIDKEKRKTYEVHLRLSPEDYVNIRTNASLNGMKITEYIRNKALSETYCKINTDYDLFNALNKAINVLTRSGNYMVKVISLCELSENYIKSIDLKTIIEIEKQSVLQLKKNILEYKTKIKKLTEEISKK